MQLVLRPRRALTSRCNRAELPQQRYLDLFELPRSRSIGIMGAQAQQAQAIYSVIYTPLWFAVLSLIGGVIIGFVVAVIVSIFTKKGDPRVVI